ncbi:MAG: helix-hairpin-helix domain-containing protein [Sphingobacteriales bacterium]|nr:MAG: helix-hairpin-helix domain-containing protein [Sphingobacteriales bacterium]
MRNPFIKYLFWFIGLACIYAVPLQAQPLPEGKEDNLPSVDEMIENLTEDLEDAEIDYDTYQEKLYDYLQKPLKLNKVDYDDISELGLLSDIQINGILNYRNMIGNFISIYELQSVPELDMETCRRIAPFFTAGDLDDFHIPVKHLFYKGQHQIFIRYTRLLENQAGFIPSTQSDGTEAPRYKGSPERIYTRYRYNYGTRLSYGFTAEKDPGEEFFRGSQKRGFDFYSAHLYLRNIGVFKHVALGDYEIRLGQGLIAWTGLAFRKSSFVMNIARNSQPVKAYTSVNEALFYRGGAATVGHKNWEATLFASYKPIDANLTTQVSDTTIVDVETEEGDVVIEDAAELQEASSLLISGLHRTDAELADRNAIRQFVTGGSMGYKSRKLQLCFNSIYTRLDANLVPQTSAYNQYRFTGNELLNISMDYRFLWRNFHFFGETAISDNGGLATLNGLLVALDSKVSLSVLHRYYQRNFQTLYAAPFAESTLPNNETGTFIGLFLKPIYKIEISAYADIYKHPWLKFLTDAPSHGADFLLQATFKPVRDYEMYLRFRTETKGRNTPDNITVTDYLSDQLRGNLRYHLQCRISKTITLKTRLETTWYKHGEPPAEFGYMIMQDFIFKPLSFPLSFSTRFALFDTPSYNTRIYAYENDVLFVFSVPPYYNRGSRFYLTLRYKVFKNLDVWLRFAQTYWANQDSIGTGNDQIEGNTRSEVKAMMRVKF